MNRKGRAPTVQARCPLPSSHICGVHLSSFLEHRSPASGMLRYPAPQRVGMEVQTGNILTGCQREGTGKAGPPHMFIIPTLITVGSKGKISVG